MIAMEPEDVMNRRDGSVLGKKTILKSDHFPGCQNKKLTLQIDGAPNYRQVWTYVDGTSFFILLLLLLRCYLFLVRRSFWLLMWMFVF